MRPEDLDEVLGIERASFSMPWSRGAFLYEMEQNRVARCWVAREDGRVVGYLCLWEVAGELHITNVAVHPTVRRRGIARTLLGGVLRHPRQRGLRRVGLSTMLLSMAPPHTYGYSGGPLRNVTDLAPTCAGCHSSYSKDQLRNEPEAFANGQVKENKHYKAIEDGSGPYQQMSPADRQKLLADVKLMDELASVNLSAPASLRPGQEAQVTVTVKGGHGVVGVLLLDTDL